MGFYWLLKKRAASFKMYLVYALFLVFVLFWSVPLIWGSNNLPPRVTLGGQPLTGGRGSAQMKLTENIKSYLSSDFLIFFEGKKKAASISEIGIIINEGKTVENVETALAIGRFSTEYAFRFWESLLLGYKVPLIYSFDGGKLENFVVNQFGTKLYPFREASLEIRGETISLVPATGGIGLDSLFISAQVIESLHNWKDKEIQIKTITVEPDISTEEARRMKEEIEKLVAYPYVFKALDYEIKLPKQTILTWLNFEKIQNDDLLLTPNSQSLSEITNILFTGKSFLNSKNNYLLTWNINEDKIKNFLKEEIQGKVYRNKKNGVIYFENNLIKELVSSQSEITVDVEKAIPAVSSAFRNGNYFIDLPVKETPADISLEKIKELGINALIGKGESNFTGSPKNRKHNLGVGAGKFNGAVIEKGEEFSFLETLGPVDKSTGYLPELVIKQDKTVPEYGGGMCQVSSTAFRAAVNSGLRVTERQNHAYPVQYYAPQGTDATVYIPKPDLKFVNNTPGPVLIQTRIDGNLLFFEFFGVSDGRKIELEGPRVWDKKSDGSMKAEWIQRVYDKEGKLMFQKNFLSKYDSPSKYPHPGDEKPPKEEKKKKKKKN